MEAFRRTIIHGIETGLKVDCNGEIRRINYNGCCTPSAMSLIEAVELGNDRIKPYLINLSDIREEIESGRFNMDPITSGTVEFLDKESHSAHNPNDLAIKQLFYYDVESLINHHFNVFGLKENQYIRVTEENNPYTNE